MRLEVTHDFSSRVMSVARYLVLDPDRHAGERLTQSLDQLEKLRSHMEAMADKVPGENFIKTSMDQQGLQFCVKFGTSKGGKRFDFRSFCGWVELCDME
ncbi:MAG: hypothetical protein ACI92I_000210 [Acidimicrobiales bacterium]|jgi:hypothetical protein